MKANEAPEKIYILPHTDYSDRQIMNAFTEKEDSTDIEYTRTGVIIKKACDGIEHLLSGYIIKNFHFGDSYETDTFIEDFKNYMKGE